MSNLYFPKIIRTVLADDEDIALHRLRKALEAYPFIHIVGEAKAGDAAISLINELLPDLVFIDIQMPQFTGFEVLTYLHKIPMIVFVTAYEEYAVKAFEKNSLDYLLKPVEAARLAITIQRVMEKDTKEINILDKIKGMLDVGRKKTISTIPINTGTKINFIYVQDIFYFEARDKYVFIHTADKEYLVDYSLAYLEERLPEEFIRIHRSHVINRLKIQVIHKYFKGTYLFILNDSKNTRIKSSYSYSDAIKTQLLIP